MRLQRQRKAGVYIFVLCAVVIGFVSGGSAQTLFQDDFSNLNNWSANGAALSDNFRLSVGAGDLPHLTNSVQNSLDTSNCAGVTLSFDWYPYLLEGGEQITVKVSNQADGWTLAAHTITYGSTSSSTSNSANLDLTAYKGNKFNFGFRAGTNLEAVDLSTNNNGDYFRIDNVELVCAPRTLELAGPAQLQPNQAGNFTVGCDGNASTTTSVNITATPLVANDCNTTFSTSSATINNIVCDGTSTSPFTVTANSAPSTSNCMVTVTATDTTDSSIKSSINVPVCPSTGCVSTGTGPMNLYEWTETDPANTLSAVTLSECDVTGNYWLCDPSATGCGGALTITGPASDPENRLASVNTLAFSTHASLGCCAQLNFTATNDQIANSYSSLQITASRGTSDPNPKSIPINFKEQELPRDAWSWAFDGIPVWGRSSTITGSIKIDPTRYNTLCSASFDLQDDPNYNRIESGLKVTDGSETYCPAAEWNFTFSDDTTSYSATPPTQSSIPFKIAEDTFTNRCLPLLCVGSANDRIGSTATTRPNSDKCEIMYPPGASFYYPTFVMTASYDWMHNFYDDNLDADGTNTDPDTDNFNKIITIDANLFPIHTALNGDYEFPNIAMRNWTSGADTPSPSVNDYMNRSVAAVANYLPYTTTIYYDYGATDGIKAVGMRSYMEWVYALDPANNNLRRYKYSKVPDLFTPPLLMDNLPAGDVASADSVTSIDIQSCSDCDNCHWYIGTTDRLLCQGNSSSANGCCYDADSSESAGGTQCNAPSPPAYLDEQEWAVLAQGNLTECAVENPGPGNPQLPTCDASNFPPVESAPNPVRTGAPGIRFPVMIEPEHDNGDGTLDVVLRIPGHTHDQNSGLAFVLNQDLETSDPDCFARIAIEGGNTSNKLQFESTGQSITCAECENEYVYGDDSVETAFQGIPKRCMQTDFKNEEYLGYMTVDIYPCGQGTGIVLQVPRPPNPKDNAFTVNPLEKTDPDAWNAMSSSQQEYYGGEGRWVMIDGYLDTVPARSYRGYSSYVNGNKPVGYGFASNTSFGTADFVRFKNPRDVDAFRDYYDVQNEGPAYVFVADTMNSRIQVFMNATGSAGEVGTTFPIRPVRIKGPNDTTNNTSYKSNELGTRLFDANDPTKSVAVGNGRRTDVRRELTVDGKTWSSSQNNEAAGSFFYPHSIAVDQDPDSRDVYLYVADTYNHRIQVFRDLSGVTMQNITSKRFNFEFETGWGSYPLQTSMSLTAPGLFNYRYPKGLDVMRFSNNSSYLYVADAKNYRVLKYLIVEDPAADPENGNLASSGITEVEPKAIYYYDGSSFQVTTDPGTSDKTLGKPNSGLNEVPGFLNLQDVATGYSGFFIADLSGEKKTVFLNNNMVYITDYARNNTVATESSDTDTDRLNMRVMQFIDSPQAVLSNVWLPWRTTEVPFGSYTSYNMTLGQSVFGINGGVHDSEGEADDLQGSSNNIPGAVNLFSERPAGIAALQWNTQKPIDIRVVPADSFQGGTNATANAYIPMKDELPIGTPLRIGVSSRVQRFQSPLEKAKSFWNASTVNNDFDIDILGRWDAMKSGRVHFFCYDSNGVFSDHTALQPPTRRDLSTDPSINPDPKPLSYQIQLDDISCPSGGIVKIVAEDADYAYSARSGTIFYRLQ